MPKSDVVIIEAEVQVPEVPNYLRVLSPLVVDKDRSVVPISTLSDDDLRKIGKLWTQRLLERAAEQRKEAAD